MARITDASKVEVLREIVVAESYPDATLTFRTDTNGDPTIAVSMEDPRVSARNEVRKWIEARQQVIVESGMDAVVDLADALDEIDRLDAKTQTTWGRDAGKQLPYGFTVYLTREIGAALANLLTGKEIASETRETVRTALTGESNTKGF